MLVVDVNFCWFYFGNKINVFFFFFFFFFCDFFFFFNCLIIGEDV